MTCGVYQIETRPGRIYIGSSKNVEGRVKAHLGGLRRGNHSNDKLQASANKNGVSHRLLLVCREADLIFYEQLCIDAFKPELNLSSIAGRPEHTPEVRAKMRAKRALQVQTPEMNAKRSATQKGNPSPKGMLGKHQSDHCKEVNRARMTGRTVSLETRARTSASLKGRSIGPFTLERKANLSKAAMGNTNGKGTRTRAQRENMRAAALKREANKRARNN